MNSLPQTPSFRLEGKRAIVAGASSGIGFGCAAALLEAGAHVVMASRAGRRLDEAVDMLQTKGRHVERLGMDVADVVKTTQVVRDAGVFDILVNSAGMARHGAAIDTGVDDFDAVVSVNLRGAYFLTRAVALGLIAANRPGSLINISSQMGHVGGKDRAVYCATKHAVEGFTKAMAIEWGPRKIRVNTICPTFVRTPLTTSMFSDPERVAWMREKIKLGRVGEIEDVMGAAVYLASDASAMVTGTAMMIDGGWTAE